MLACRWSVISFGLVLSLLVGVHGQSQTQSGSSTQSLSNSQSNSQSNSRSQSATATTSASTSVDVSLSLVTSSVTISTNSVSGSRTVAVSAVVPTTFNVTVTSTPTSSASTSANATASATSSATASATPIQLDTRIDPAFGVLGGLLIITGIPSAFLGHKNRWSSFFLIGWYTLSLVCLVLILQFGVLRAINPPTRTVRGLFVLACGIAGIAGGGVAIFFWKATKFFVGGWGGFALALWIQCFRDGGLISPIGLRWIMYIALGVTGFVLCTIPKLHYPILLVSTSIVGASAFILGIDCYTTAGLKEFYIWNLGFTAMFPKFTNNDIKFPLSQTMEIELGLIAAIALMGAAVQFQILKVLQHKLREIRDEQRRRDEAAEARAAERFVGVEREKEEWERDHGTLAFHGRNESGLSGTPLLKDPESPEMSPADDRRASGFTLIGTPRQRYASGVSDFYAAPRSSAELDKAIVKQSPGALPVLDLGTDIERDVPQNFMADTPDAQGAKGTRTAEELETIKRKEELLAEIHSIRKSIDVLRSETPGSSSSESRHPSLNSKHALSADLSSYMASGPSTHLRPPRAVDPRGRVQSMELSNLYRSTEGVSISRPTSVPLRDENWDAYVHDRKLLQPPSGVSAPIPVSPLPKIPVSPAVAEALLQRQRRESALSLKQLEPLIPDRLSAPARASPVLKDSSSEDAPLASLVPTAHKKSPSQGIHAHAHTPVVILPPRKSANASHTQEPPLRVHTFEELAERHREKLHELQAPLTQAEQEQAALAEAKIKWERVKAHEKQAVAKRQAEKAEALKKEAEKKRLGATDEFGARGTTSPEGSHKRHHRSLSANVLAAVPGPSASSKRTSTMKVEDWQRHQEDLGETARPRHDQGSSESKRRSAVPFPDAAARPRDSRRASGFPRDPPS